MKILISGKGGCGKSTISALLSKEIARRSYEVLVMDTDESNVGLHLSLGVEPPEDFMNYFGGKEVLFERVETLKGEWDISNLPEQFVTEKNGVKLMIMGKIYDFGEGCACPINALTSRFLESLKLSEEEFLVADTDAGIEHLGRGVDRGADLILVVVEPSQESILLARKITEMGEEINTDVVYVLNKVDGKVEDSVSKSLDKSKILGLIPRKDRISSYGLKGKELDFPLQGVKNIVDSLVDR